MYFLKICTKCSSPSHTLDQDTYFRRWHKDVFLGIRQYYPYLISGSLWSGCYWPVSGYWDTRYPPPSVSQSFWNFTQSTTMPLPCFAQNYKRIGLLKWMLWTDEISWDLSLKWISEGILCCDSPWCRDTDLCVKIPPPRTTRLFHSPLPQP